MKDWKPQAKPLSPEDQKSLSVEEILVLACVDGRTSVAEIPYTTGMPPDVVEEIVERLTTRGALVRESVPPPLEIASLDDLVPVEEHDAKDGLEHASAADELIVVGEGDEEDVPPLEQPEPEPDADLEPGPEDSPEEAPAEAPDPQLVSEDASLEERSVTYRQLYQQRLSHMSRDERMLGVLAAVEPELSAYCFDPEPPIIHKIFENARAGLAHARLVAAHHRTTSGLEVLAKHQSMLHDGQVQRLLLRNVMLPQSLFTRILQPKRLSEIYRTMLSRDIPERTRNWARNMLRQKWPMASSEERVEVVWQTEGRVLPILVGLNLDSKSTAMLCKRQFASVLFVRAFATWPATPPPLITHLLKQPLVKRLPQLRNMLLRHPNVSSDAKRKG